LRHAIEKAINKNEVKDLHPGWVYHSEWGYVWHSLCGVLGFSGKIKKIM